MPRPAPRSLAIVLCVDGPAPAAARRSPRFRARVGGGTPSLSTAGAP